MLRLRPLLRIGSLLLLLLGLVCAPRLARADEGPIHLVVRGDELPRDKVRDAIAKELGRPVVLEDEGTSTLNVVTVTYREAEGDLTVSWASEKRGAVNRVVPARPKRADVIVDAALLAGNLVRDEAGELVKKDEPPPLPPPEPTPLPTPTPVATEALRDRALPPPRDPNEVPVNAGFFYPLATNLGRPQLRTRFDFNVLHGRIGQLDGVQLGGFNVIEKRLKESTGDMTGVQIGSLGNLVWGTTNGMQIGGLGNAAANAMTGWQIGGIGNYAGADMTGFQTAALLNITSGTVRGVQLGAINIGGDVKGMQLGFINVARKVQGGMFGAVNVADDVEGVPFGIASVTKTGGVHPTAWGASTTYANVGVRLATKHTYTMPMGHFHHAYGKDFYGAGFVVGGRIPIDDARYVDTDLGFSWLAAPERTVNPGDPDTYHEHLLQPKLRAMIGWRLASHFGFFAGAGLLTQIRLERDMELVTVRIGPDFFLGVEL